MTFWRLLGRNLLYHWRGNLAVLLGVMLGTAVLTGALLVGDSLRGSLRALMLDRLGWIEQAMLPGHFFRERLTGELSARQASSVVLLSGSAGNTRSGAEVRRAGGVNVLGVDAEFWPQGDIPLGSAFWQSDAAEAVLTQSLADRLGVTAGDALTLAVPRPEEMPRESLLGKRKAKDVLQSLDVTVRLVLPDAGIARFTLKPTPEPARNVFVPRRFLQLELGLGEQANALFAAGAPLDLAKALSENLTLDDWGLKLRSPRDRALAFVHYLAPHEEEGRLKKARWRDRVPLELAKGAEANKGILTREEVVAFYERHRPYVSLESRRSLLPRAVVEAARAIGTTGRRELFVYLADHVTNGPAAPYYVVVGAVQTVGTQGRLPVVESLAPEQIVLLDTPEAPWVVAPGATVTVAYYKPDEQNHLRKESAAFAVRAKVPLRGALDDPDLTPEFPGITDRLTMGSWQNPPFPYNPKLAATGETYWTRYRATPRAYVSMDTANRLWGSRFGNRTSIQFFGTSESRLRGELLANLLPERGGFEFQPLRANAEAASNGSTDFGMLFVAFSCFLIAAALLLVGLLFRLNLDRRASEIGLLLAVGWSHALVRWLLLAEGTALALVGALAGLAVALGYARLMLGLLRANWPGGDNLAFLQLHAAPASLFYGFLAALAISVLTIVWATRVLGSLTPRSLLAGVVSSGGFAAAARSRVGLAIALISAVAAIGLVIAGFFVQGQEAKAGSFFGSGALLLVACLAAVRLWLRHTARASSPRPSLTALGVRNAGRHAVRSLLTVGLLAAATFLIVAVESFHKDVGSGFLDIHGGSGGFALVAETAVPIFEDLNQPAVRKELGLTQPALAGATFVPCRVRGGDDASCLNLYQPLQPRVVGVPLAAVTGRFHFGATLAASSEEKEHPWSLLERTFDDGAIPAIVDATTAEYGLHTGLGSTVAITNDKGEKVPLRIVGLLDESIFQSEILVSDANFRALFPTHEGFTFFLVQCTDDGAGAVRDVQSAIETDLAGQGVRVETCTSRLLSYLAVENMYLTTFQALGGLGLILGAAGLAIILLRGVWERRGELALLRALGFGSGRLAWLVLSENLALLLLGLASGTLAALLSVAPHLAGAEAHVLWLRIAVLLLLVLATGLSAGSLAVVTTLRAPLLAALRRD